MKYVTLTTPKKPFHLEPLSNTRALADCRAAGKPFIQLQQEALARLGYSLSEKGDYHLPANLYPLTGPDQDGSFQGHWIRYPWDFLTLQESLLGAMTESIIEGDLSPAAHIEGTLILGKGSRVLPGVYIEGNVVIGEHCKIGPNAYLRGFTSIGDHCHIGQAVEVKNSIVYSGSSIAHLSYCGDSIIGEKVNLGAGTIISNYRHDKRNHFSMVAGELVDTGRLKFGAILGDAVHTGIHTSIYPGRKLWPGSSTRPGDIVQKDIVPHP